MALNDFTKEQIVAFDNLLAGFEDALVMSTLASVYSTDQTMMARTNDIIWRPQPYIATSYDGLDQTGNFKAQTQLSVPATIGYKKSSPWTMNAIELRDALQENRLGEAAKQKLASDINVSVQTIAALQGTLVVTVSAAPGQYSDVAKCDTLMTSQGVMMNDRKLALSSASYNGMANNLQAASRSFGNSKSDRAYEDSFVGRVAGFETYKLDYAKRIAAAAGGGSLTIDTRTAAGNYWIPVATRTAATGETSNVDNRFQTVTISSTTNVAAGDCFTIDGVEAVHHITKESTGELKTFRVIDVLTSTAMVISPPIISTQGATEAEAQYQNVEVTGAATAPITFLNSTATDANPFFYKDSIEILPGRLAIPSNAGAQVLRSTTKQGIEVVFSKFYDINTLDTKFRLDVLWGVVNKQPEMSGILLFNQS
jgi:hypothetical protein